MLQPAAIDGLAFVRNAAVLEGRLGMESLPRLAQSGCSGSVLDFVLTGEINERGKPGLKLAVEDRKSTRLNSSHGYISYAGFCLQNHHVHTESLRESFKALTQDAASVVDGMTWREYEKFLYFFLRAPQPRVPPGPHRAPPSRR